MKITWEQFIKLISENKFQIGDTIFQPQNIYSEQLVFKYWIEYNGLDYFELGKEANGMFKVVILKSINQEVEINFKMNCIVLNTNVWVGEPSNCFNRIVIRLIQAINLEEMFLEEEARVLAKNQDKRDGVLDSMDSAKILSNENTTGWGGCGEPLS